MEKVTNTTADDVRSSVSSIYSALLNKRQKEKEEKEEAKRLAQEEKEAEKQDKEAEKEEKISKRAKREKELEAWKLAFSELTGDDIEYTSKKKGKKKYRKWIDDDLDNAVQVEKAKKIKKKNYRKEFEPELNMLKTLLAEQNRINTDMLKRFQNAAGPATKDAMFPNKTLVELLSTINAGKTNALSMLREIGNLKKTVADLEMKRKKLEADMGGGSNIENMDLGLMGSQIASNMFSSGSPYSTPMYETPRQETSSQPDVLDAPPIDDFDPSTWGGITSATTTAYEELPHKIYVENDLNTGNKRFVAIRTDTGEEINVPNLPTVDPNSLPFDENKMTIRGKFDEVYEVKNK